jgi:hypothetical protein
MSFLRSSAVAGIVAAVSLAAAGTAMASPTVVRDSGPAPNNVPGGTNSDCAIRAQLVNDPANGNVYGRGYASCNTWKRDITVETVLKRTLSSGAVQTFTSGARSTPSPTWIYSAAVFNGCDKYQTVLKAWITDSYGRQTYNYVTTSTPMKFNDHCPW